MQAWKARFYFYLVGAKSVKNEEENKQKKSLSPSPSPKREGSSMLSISMELMINIYFVDSISQAFYSPLSSERGWGRGCICLVSLRKGAGGEALFAPFLLVVFSFLRLSLPHKKSLCFLQAKGRYLDLQCFAFILWGTSHRVRHQSGR